MFYVLERVEPRMQGARIEAQRRIRAGLGWLFWVVNPGIAHEKRFFIGRVHRFFNLSQDSLVVVRFYPNRACSRWTIVFMAAWTSAGSGSTVCSARRRSTSPAARPSIEVAPRFSHTECGFLSASFE